MGGGSHCDGFDRGVLEAIPSPDAPVVFVPSADGNTWSDSWGVGNRGLKENGFNNVHVLHTWDRKETDSADLVKPMQECRSLQISAR